jgi:hypothetical protein
MRRFVCCLAALAAVCRMGFGGTLDYSLYWFGPTGGALGPPPLCIPTFGPQSLRVDCAGVQGPASITVTSTSPFSFSLGLSTIGALDNNELRIVEPNGDVWYVDVSGQATYTGAFAATGGLGPAWLDFDLSGSGYNSFSGNISIAPFGISRSFFGVGGVSHYHVPITFGQPIPYMMSVLGSSAVQEPNISGAVRMDSFMLTDAEGNPIPGFISEVAVPTPEPGSLAMWLLFWAPPCTHAGVRTTLRDGRRFTRSILQNSRAQAGLPPILIPNILVTCFVSRPPNW